MAKNLAYRTRMAGEAQALITRLIPTQNAFDTLYTTIANPICGKPGKGFKAARKRRAELAALQQQVDAIETEIATFIRPNTKTSLVMAEKRRQFINEARRACGC